MSGLIRDLKYALRRLAHTPGFTVATLITLALGIGANSAIFSVINSVLLRPLPFYEPDRLIGVWQTAPGVNVKDLKACIADYVTYREHSNTFVDVALWRCDPTDCSSRTLLQRSRIQACQLLLGLCAHRHKEPAGARIECPTLVAAVSFALTDLKNLL